MQIHNNLTQVARTWNAGGTHMACTSTTIPRDHRAKVNIKSTCSTQNSSSIAGDSKLITGNSTFMTRNVTKITRHSHSHLHFQFEPDFHGLVRTFFPILLIKNFKYSFHLLNWSTSKVGRRFQKSS